MPLFGPSNPSIRKTEDGRGEGRFSDKCLFNYETLNKSYLFIFCHSSVRYGRIRNPSFVKKDSGHPSDVRQYLRRMTDGMTDPIPRSSTTGISFMEYLKVILGTSILIQADCNMHYVFSLKIPPAPLY